jgi:hypothetical protein
MEELVNAVLMSISEGAILQIVEVVKMSLTECLRNAAEVNASDAPFVLMCSPIVDTSIPL